MSWCISSVEQWSPTFLAQGTGLVEDIFSMDEGGGWFQDDSSSLYLLYTSFLLLLHCDINEIIVQLTIMQNQWEPWAHFLATRQSHLGMMWYSDIWSVLLISRLLHNLILVASQYWPMAQKVRDPCSRETEPIGSIYLYRNWFMWLWRLRSLRICYLQFGETGKPTVQFNLSPKV